MWWKKWTGRYPLLGKLYVGLSWLALLGFLVSLFFVPGSRRLLLQYIWSVYVLIQFWLLARSKTVTWRQAMLFFLATAWLVVPFTGAFVSSLTKWFGASTNAHWSQAVLTPIAEEVFKLLPLGAYLFVSRRASALSLGDYAMLGAASGAGFQFMEETARRWTSGIIPYGYSLLDGKSIHWNVTDLFPGYLEPSYFPTIITYGHAVQTSLVSIGIGIAVRFWKQSKRGSAAVPALLLLWVILDHAMYNGQYGMPGWLRHAHDAIGSGYATKPLLLALLLGAIIYDYVQLNQVRSRLPLLPGERWIGPFTEWLNSFLAFFRSRERFAYLLVFYRERKRLGFTLLYGEPDAQEELDGIRSWLERVYRPLTAAAAALVLLLTAAWMTIPVVADDTGTCFACMFDSLQSWWDRRTGWEQAAILAGMLAVSLLFIEFLPALGAVSTISGVLGGGHSIAAAIRNPASLLTPGNALALAVDMGLSRIPMGRQLDGAAHRLQGLLSRMAGGRRPHAGHPPAGGGHAGGTPGGRPAAPEPPGHVRGFTPSGEATPSPAGAGGRGGGSGHGRGDGPDGGGNRGDGGGGHGRGDGPDGGGNRGDGGSGHGRGDGPDGGGNRGDGGSGHGRGDGRDGGGNRGDGGSGHGRGDGPDGGGNRGDGGSGHGRGDGPDGGGNRGDGGSGHGSGDGPDGDGNRGDGSGDGRDTDANRSPEPEAETPVRDIGQLANTANFRPGSLEHILEGELNRRGSAVGYHYEGMPNARGSVVPGTETAPDGNGVYRAQVAVDGVPKAGNGGFSSFFPKEMEPQQIVDAVNEAFANRTHVTGNVYTGTSADGLPIQMYLDRSGRIISAFPY
ncbi:EndoU domain-containing protein [Paenibacillus sp. J31TS4]|uniref:EndoU domain-containing protein n=1 Tax=Paenibacillus sp. J31TS4 TaxID=2807195 RepID=UPI001BCDDE0F|nr:EndoU domain-containing protein [Paenibacillus sp. J31TS4]